MLKIKGLSIIIFLALLSSSFSIVDTQSITIDNIQVDKGKVIIELYDKEEDWLEKATHRKEIKPTKESLTVSINIPKKAYSISIYQDMNNNGKLDQGWFGIPTEPVGFGNNYKPMGKPKFKPALVDFKTLKAPSVIRLYEVF